MVKECKCHLHSLSNLVLEDQDCLHAEEASPHPALAGTLQKSSSIGSPKLEQHRNICSVRFMLLKAFTKCSLNIYTFLEPKESAK